MIKRFLANALRAFFIEQSTFYSVYVITTEGERPLCQWYRGLNPPRVGEFIATEKEEAKNSPKPEEEFEYYKVVSISHIFYKTKFNKNGAEPDKKEAIIIVKYVGDQDPNKKF